MTFEFSLTPAGDGTTDVLVVLAVEALRASGYDALSEIAASSIRLRVTASDVYEAWHAVFDARRTVYDALTSVSDVEVRTVRSKAII